MSKEFVDRLSVWIQTKEKQALGSGTLYVADNYAYIYTAAHIFDSIRENPVDILVYVKKTEDTYDTLTIPYDNVFIHKEYNNSDGINKYDVAIIRIQKQDYMYNEQRFLICNELDKENFYGLGFPDAMKEEDPLFASNEILGSVHKFVHGNPRIQVKLSSDMEIDQSRRDKELLGYSGSGLFTNLDNYGAPPCFIGVFSYGQGRAATQNTVNVFSAELFIDICKQKKLEIPELSSAYPLSFAPYKEYALSGLNNARIKSLLGESMGKIIGNQITPVSLVDKVGPIYEIPECVCKTRNRCKYMWQGRLRTLALLQLLNIDLYNPVLKGIESDEDTPLDVICTEGLKGNNEIKEVVHSIKERTYIWKDVFKNGSILLWISNSNPITRAISRNRFSRISNDYYINPEKMIKNEGLDIYYGEKKADNLSIVHIAQILQWVDELEDDCSIDDIDKTIKENLKRYV